MSTGGQFEVITSSSVNVRISSTISSFCSERRYQKDLTISALKGKLELIVGAQAQGMILELYNKDDKKVCDFNDDEKMLGFYPVEDDMRIHVIDKCGKIGEFEDLSKVEKYEISEEEYAKKTDSVRAFKQRMKLGQFANVNKEEAQRKEEEKEKKELQEKTMADNMNIGDRCEVKVKGQLNRRGTVKYVGSTEFKPGYWVGIQYDEPLGKNDGSVQGKRYFECPPKYGAFVKPDAVEIGDFPEEFDGLDDEDEM